MEKNNKIKELEQEADKLRQENEVLLEYKHFIEKFRMRRPEHPDDERPWVPMLMDSERKNDTLTKENKALRAQVSGLVGALMKFQYLCTCLETRTDLIEKKVIDSIRSDVDKALSTLPSQYLEIAKAKEALIKAAFFRTTHGCNDTCGCQLGDYPCSCGHIRLTEALHTLQQAEEKK